MAFHSQKPGPRCWTNSQRQRRIPTTQSTKEGSLRSDSQRDEDYWRFPLRIAATLFASSAHAQRRSKNERSMKNIKTDSDDLLRAEYKRSDFGELVRGKYA